MTATEFVEKGGNYMLSKRNEIIFKKELVVLDYLFNEYKKEIKETTIVYGDVEIKNTKVSRLNRLRLEINELLKKIEKECPRGYEDEVE